MMAESLSFCGPTGSLSGWELDAWYEDLQDILCSDTKNTELFQPVTVNDQELVPGDLDNPYIWTLDSLSSPLPVDFNDAIDLEDVVQQLPSDTLELLNTELPDDGCSVPPNPLDAEGAQSYITPEQDSCSPAYTLTEDEESCTSQCSTKRKRHSQPKGGKVRVKEREQENEKKVQHLVAENERLKGEIERLSIEVEKTRKALIDRMVNLKTV
ncbi:DNA damage-inducible transcript 3 protein [Bombina bombina]|uniref:DNA damage-inducible transcript 3 protein n=1 Tax=Bombina bombina TaxID=8345 RepID=UPI00235AAD6D|nr:DNA damage-inducible transcript 3 protein [Bombina bombina]